MIAPQPFFEDRGTPIAVRELVTALSGLGFDVDLATFPVGRALHLPGVRLVRGANPFRIRRVPIGFSLKKLVLDFFLFFTALGLLRRHRYLCVHGVEEGGFIAALLAQRFEVPVVYDMQSCLPDGMREHRAFRGASAQGARALVTEHSPAAIACAISQVLRDRTLASGLAARARLYAETHLHPARFASSVHELCEALGAESWEAVGV